MIALAFSLALSGAFSVSGQVTGTPPGFKPVDEAQIFRRPEPKWDATTFEVSLVGDRLRVETAAAQVARTRREETAALRVNPKFVIDLGMSRVTWSPGQGVRVSDGWLCGFDHGEFGGGLYWFASDGSRYRRVDDKNIPIVVKSSKGVFAIRSLTHLMFWYADLVAVERTERGWATRPITDLHRSPGPTVQAGDRFIYAVDDYVSTLETDGTQRELYHFWGRVQPWSMVRRSNGELWVGCTEALLRLTPKASGRYTPQWFVPLTRR